jgi:hypothetical protein
MSRLKFTSLALTSSLLGIFPLAQASVATSIEKLDREEKQLKAHEQAYYSSLDKSFLALREAIGEAQKSPEPRLLKKILFSGMNAFLLNDEKLFQFGQELLPLAKAHRQKLDEAMKALNDLERSKLREVLESAERESKEGNG